MALSAAQLATAMIQLCVQHGERQPLLGSPALGDALVLYKREEEGGYTILAENLSPMPMRVEVDASEHTQGFLSSRGALFCQVLLPLPSLPSVTCIPTAPSLPPPRPSHTQSPPAARRATPSPHTNTTHQQLPRTRLFASPSVRRCSSQDIVPPRSRQLLLVLSADMRHKRHALGMRFDAGSVEPGAAMAGHIPDLDDLEQLKVASPPTLLRSTLHLCHPHAASSLSPSPSTCSHASPGFSSAAAAAAPPGVARASANP